MREHRVASSNGIVDDLGAEVGEYRDVWYETNFVSLSDWPTSSLLATIAVASSGLTSTSTSNIAVDSIWCRTAHAIDILLFVHW